MASVRVLPVCPVCERRSLYCYGSVRTVRDRRRRYLHCVHCGARIAIEAPDGAGTLPLHAQPNLPFRAIPAGARRKGGASSAGTADRAA